MTPTLARRLAITKQRLAGPRPAPGPEGLLEVARDLGCVQLDPISAVDRSHRLVWPTRVGKFASAHLDQVVWQERRMFEYWAYQASLVLTEDFSLHHLMMRRYPGRGTAWAERTRLWIKQNDKLRRYVLSEIRRRGPMPSRQLDEDGQHPEYWVSTGWTSGRNVSRMLDFLQMQGKIMVAGRAGGQKIWDLSERVLPPWTPRDRLTEREIVRHAAERSLRALGLATPRQISLHFLRGRYTDLPRVLADLERKGRVQRVQVQDETGTPWRGEWYIHSADLPGLGGLANGDWREPARTTLLSPFDNLICDRLIGRIDPLMDRAQGRLRINAVYAESSAPADPATGRAVAGANNELADFLGATTIDYDARRLPAGWKRELSA